MSDPEDDGCPKCARIEGRVAELQAELEELRAVLAKAEYDRNGYYGEWTAARDTLAQFRGSPAWKLWQLSLLLKRVLLWPVKRTRRLAGWLLLALPRLLGLFYLALVAATIGLKALWPGSATAAAAPAPGLDTPLRGRRPRVLIVSPYRIFPPNHGGAVRLFNLVTRLSASCDVYLLLFSQQGEDAEQRRALEPFCRRVDFHRWLPRIVPGWLGLDPPNALLFRSAEASARVRDIVVSFGIDVVQLEYAELAHLAQAAPEGVPVILTEHDIAFRSHLRKLRLGFHQRYPEGTAFGASWRDWLRLLRYEVRSCRTPDQLHVMSDADGEFLGRFLPDGRSRIRVVPNGVDCAHYQPPTATERQDVLYLGNFQNLPNVDALEYLVTDVWPLVRLRCPDARLSVVGANPSPRVQRFDGRDGVHVVGEVADLRPVYHQHRLLVAPIRAGSGTRLKILEAFASGLPVVSTPLGAEGIAGEHGTHLLLAESPVDFARAVEQLLVDDQLHRRIAAAALALADQVYDWRHVTNGLVDAYRELVAAARTPSAGRSEGWAPLRDLHHGQPTDGAPVDISVVIPTLNGGTLLAQTLEAIATQRVDRPYEVVCVDSGSRPEEIETMRRHGARVVSIDQREFNHGLTRDLGAAASRGSVLVFTNQDAVPADPEWLARLTRPMFAGDPRWVAVQGGIREVDDLDRRFFWDSCGERFYFTRESRRWIMAHGGIGFSTVNCAIRRKVWERYPFGWAEIMEDKRWQRAVLAEGHLITTSPATVVHTHVYDLRGLVRRCLSEGFGWRSMGETYSLRDMTRDMLQRKVWGELARGLRARRVRSSAELLFPCLRPLAVYVGNHLSRGVAL